MEYFTVPALTADPAGSTLRVALSETQGEGWKATVVLDGRYVYEIAMGDDVPEQFLEIAGFAARTVADAPDLPGVLESERERLEAWGHDCMPITAAELREIITAASAGAPRERLLNLAAEYIEIAAWEEAPVSVADFGSFVRHADGGTSDD